MEKKLLFYLKSKKIEEAKPLMKKISDNYKKLLDYFPDKPKKALKQKHFQVFGKTKMSLML